MATHWSIDLGTTNTLIAKWVGTQAVTVALQDLVEYEPAWHTPLIPSAIYFTSPTIGCIGRAALSAQEIDPAAGYGGLSPLARSFKKSLARESQRTVAQVGSETISARQCATVFLRELLLHTREYEAAQAAPVRSVWQKLVSAARFWRKEGQVVDLTMTVPVDSYEPYRAELSRIAHQLGVSQVRTLDEPVAAALGYGMDLTDEKNVMVVDFGGGTLDIAIVRTRARDGSSGRDADRMNLNRARLLAARGVAIGGETVDGWIADLGCSRLEAHQAALRPILLSQAETIKKDLTNKANIADTSFFLLQGNGRIEVRRDEFLTMLEERGLYKALETLTEATLDDCRHELDQADLDAILLVGGSTLLPGVREMFERAFGNERVHYWEPFEAVVKGASIYGAGFSVDQIVHHDYAVRVYNDTAQRTEYERLVRRGAGYPMTAPETRYYGVIPGQNLFRIPICEVGYAGRVSIDWARRGNGNDYWVPAGAEEGECVSTLNEGDVLRLAPPGTGQNPRLRIDYTIDENRFLCASIHDLLRQRDLRTDERVVRLR